MMLFNLEYDLFKVILEVLNIFLDLVIVVFVSRVFCVVLMVLCIFNVFWEVVWEIDQDYLEVIMVV